MTAQGGLRARPGRHLYTTGREGRREKERGSKEEEEEEEEEEGAEEERERGSGAVSDGRERR